ncbi:DUF2490 domain-containing protein [Flavobacterium rakeshii]|uniref:DUF2490 domain-containing protein n=1 Tax=Flavobacterium rakeshii TaxID=1038845 RepID=A0A6N8HA34_9FLAO|nr:DUF2490 domain-containing protein [Flavobacterium rakeshii]MUV02425.1 DUF2490 domain-containing protein [Flavobacterium rakeshii]
MMRMKFLLLTVFLSVFCNRLTAQISSPGLGETNNASWSAIGIKQQLDEKNTSVSYVGFGRISGMDESNPFGYPALFVLNEEVSHKINNHWKYSGAISYRRAHEYGEDVAEPEQEMIEQEFRLYGRVKYTTTLGRFKWTNTARQEARKFYTEDFSRVPDDLQLRTRLKSQLYYSLDHDRENIVTASAEALFSISKDRSEGWDNLNYKEARFCLYYTYNPDDFPMIFDVGYMNDLIGTGNNISDVSYIAFDIIIENPFSS